MELLNENGFEAYAQMLRILLEQAMKIERANGYKPNTVDTRLGRISVSVPQVRGDVEFFPSALEKGRHP